MTYNMGIRQIPLEDKAQAALGKNGFVKARSAEVWRNGDLVVVDIMGKRGATISTVYLTAGEAEAIGNTLRTMAGEVRRELREQRWHEESGQ